MGESSKLLIRKHSIALGRLGQASRVCAIIRTEASILSWVDYHRSRFAWLIALEMCMALAAAIGASGSATGQSTVRVQQQAHSCVLSDHGDRVAAVCDGERSFCRDRRRGQ